MLSNIFEIHIKVKPRHQKDPKLLKLKHSDRANSWKIWFWSFPQCFLAYLWKYICLFLDFQKWTKWRSAAKKLCRNNRKRKWKEKFKLVRVQWKWNNNKSYKIQQLDIWFVTTLIYVIFKIVNIIKPSDHWLPTCSPS